MRKYLYIGLFLAFSPAHAADGSPRAVYNIATVAGSASLGDGGPAIDAQIGTIQGVATDGAGNVYLSDTTHNLVRRIGTTGLITTVAGTGTEGFSGDGGPATGAQLHFPYGLAVDVNGNLYIADLGNNRVRRVSPDGTIQTFAGSAGEGSSGDGGPAISAQMLSPRNLAIDSSGNVYISEFGAHRVRKVTPDGAISTAAGTGIAGFAGDYGPATAAQLAFPTGLACDNSGNIYIADSENRRIRQVLPNGAIVTYLGGAEITLASPIAVAVDAAGDLLVGDSTPEVHEYSVKGNWTVVAGTSSPGFAGDDGPATEAELVNPLDLAIDPAGDLYIADQHRVRQVNPAGIIRTAAGADYLYGIGDGGAATAAELYLPSAVALDSGGNLYIADAGTNRVRQVSPAGTIATVAGTGNAAPGGEALPAVTTPLMTPTAVALDASGNLLIVESGANRIRAVGPDGLVRTIAGTGVTGLGADSLPATQAQLTVPQGLCLDRSGNLYIADTGNSRILRAPPGGLISTAAGNGAAGFAGDGGPASIAQLNQPAACAVDSAGNLYIADTYNHRIRKVDSTGNIITVAGTGVAGTGGDEGAATAAGLNAPRGIAVDDNGNLYISDTGNNTIRQVTPDGAIHTIAGTGAEGFAVDDGPALSAWLDSPGGILLDGSGDLYFADTNNNRIRRLIPAGTIAPPAITPPTPLNVVNAASLSSGAVSPGEVVTIFGSGMGPESGVAVLIDPPNVLGSQVDGVEVLFDNVAAPLFYAQAGQINAQVPYSVAGNASTNIQVMYQGAVVSSASAAVASSAPGVFPTAVNQDGTINSAANPIASGAYLTIYATGEGLTNGANLTGAPAAAPYPQPQLPVSVTVSGITAQVVWAGSAPGLVGLLQVDLIVPGPYLPSGATPLELSVGLNSAPLIPIWVQ
ncbi:MAG TPA: IPT/TIG domain-containing protein [Bryobacteraceae bacterium]|nr:IPT/TIG domain-containing protein [Bryobacteraceae bacterium]